MQPTESIALLTTLDRFPRVGLSTVGQDNLLDRHDLKYVFPADQIQALLRLLSSDWQILKIDEHVVHAYNNLYFDTPNFQCYLDHHNEKRSRYKFRIRTYHNTQESFLEIKEKTNKENTIKTRLPRKAEGPHLTKVEKEWLRTLQQRIDPDQLIMQLVTQYDRISLIHPNGDRLTIDQQLRFKSPDQQQAFRFCDFAIAELKKGHHGKSNTVKSTFRQMGIKPLPFSKYCLGIALSQPQLKHNRFKAKWRSIKGFQPFPER